MFTGALVNAAAIAVGSVAGMALGGALRERFRDILNQAMGLAVLFVGLSGALSGMLAEGAHPILFIVSLALGALLGEAVNIEGHLAKLGDRLQARFGGTAKANDGPGAPAAGGSLSAGFVSASLLFCVGTMAVLGALQSGTQGQHTILLAKSLVDGIIALVMASTLGVGVAFSAASVLLYEGLLVLLAGAASPFLTPDMLGEMATVGGILITAIGLNMLGLTKFRVGNLLPAVFIPPLYFALMRLFS